jgi:hypothetical protein
MAAGATYEPIATNTLGSAAASVTFSTISGSYTDLVLIATSTSGDLDTLALQLNSDTGNNYSTTIIYGTGSTAASYLESNANNMYLGLTSTEQSNSIYYLINYSNTTTYKTVLGRGNVAGGQLRAGVSLWRSTSAVTSITINRDSGGNLNSGSTFTLYGISAA